MTNNGIYILPAGTGYTRYINGIMSFMRDCEDTVVTITHNQDGYVYGHLTHNPKVRIRIAPVARGQLQSIDTQEA